MARSKKETRRPITAGQSAYYEKLCAYVRENKRPASNVDMARAMGYASDNASRKMMQALEVAGWIHPRNVSNQRRTTGAWPVDVPMSIVGKKVAGSPLDPANG